MNFHEIGVGDIDAAMAELSAANDRIDHGELAAAIDAHVDQLISRREATRDRRAEFRPNAIVRRFVDWPPSAESIRRKALKVDGS